jgi:outer membrane protein
MPRLQPSAALALLCVLTCTASRLPASDVPAFGDTSPPLDLSGTVNLQDCVGLALSRNFAVRIEHFTVFQAIDSVDVQKAAFEPSFTVAANRQVNQQASNELISFGILPYSNAETASFNMNDTLTTGAVVQAGYSLVRNEYYPSFPPNPSFASSASITVTQPLLAGAGTDYNKALLERARIGVRISNLNFKSTVLTMVLNVETTYYNLLYQREQYKVQEEELRQAQQLLDENTLKRQTGTLTDLDVMNARAGVASAQNQLILDGQAVKNSEDSLLQLLGDRTFSGGVGPITFPAQPSPDVSFAKSYAIAREQGPNLAIAQATIDQFKLDALKAKRNALPTLNVTGGLGYSSFASTAGQSFYGAWNGYNWVGGLTLTVPWGMHANRALYHQAKEQVRSQEVTFDQTDQALLVSVRSAVRAVDTGGENVRSSVENTQYARKAYELTKAQFDAGLATSYLVLQAQNTLETARVSELQAKVNLLLAVANLRFLEGSSLQLYRIFLPE